MKNPTTLFASTRAARGPTVAACGLAVALALAMPAAHAAPGDGTLPDMPTAHTQGSITYVSGGIGDAQAGAMKSAASQYPLELQFLLKESPRDAYLADVKVQVADAQNHPLLNANADGPFMFLQLPPGRYTISADNNGQVQQRQVSVSAKEHRRVVFEWVPAH